MGKQKKAHEGKLLSVKQAAEVLGVPAPTLYRWISRDLVPALHLGPTGRMKRIPKATVEMIKRSQGGNAQKAIESKSWFSHTPITIRVAEAGSDAEVMTTTRPRPWIRIHEVRQLRDLEKRYDVGTADIVLELHKGHVPKGIPEKVAHQWYELFTRASVSAH